MNDIKRVDALSEGAHSPNGHLCVMEAVAYVAGEKWSDRPECVSPLLGGFLRSWNDGLPADADRTRLLVPLIPRVMGTTESFDPKRSELAWEWLVRTWLPTWLDLVPALKPDAERLRTCEWIAIMEVLAESRKNGAAARDAAGAAAKAKLAPTVLTLQESASNLVIRMAELEERKPVAVKRRLFVGEIEVMGAGA